MISNIAERSYHRSADLVFAGEIPLLSVEVRCMWLKHEAAYRGVCINQQRGRERIGKIREVGRRQRERMHGVQHQDVPHLTTDVRAIEHPEAASQYKWSSR